MAGRIVLLGATGYTGALTATALAELAGDGAAELVLAGRNADRLAALADRIGGPPTVIADVADPASVLALVGRGDVLVTTVGPFARLGEPAVLAAVDAGAVYLDSTGEPPFIRRVFTEYGELARRGGAALFPAFGYDYVPGNLAGALALRAAGPAATSVRIGYFLVGDGQAGFSRGTARSLAGMLGEPGFALRGGALVDQPAAARLATFRVAGLDLDAVSVAGSEHLTLGRVHPGLTDVEVFIGWFGRRSGAVSRAARLGAPVLRLRPVAAATRAVARAVADRRTDPPPGSNDGQRSAVVAVASDAGGQELARVELDGIEAYQLTANLLAWAATTAAGGGVQATGALGPVDGFGLDELAAGCVQAGLHQVAVDT